MADEKLLTVSEAAVAIGSARDRGESVVLCHGCFDIVHPGHVRHLKEAARFGGRLVVSITGDAAIDKGDGRPLIPQELRAENLAALDCVDWVVISSAPTAVEVLRKLHPDVYVKGREYEHSDDPRWLAEREVVERHGGRVLFSSGDVVFSSTALISAMEDAAAPFQSRLRQLMASPELGPGTVDAVLSDFGGRRVLVAGETIIDTYVMCDRPHIAGESPVMTLRPLETRSFDGGAAIIARHLAAMGARPTLVTVLPPGGDSVEMRDRLAGEGIEVRFLPIEQPTIEKQRFLVGSTKVMKVDHAVRLTLDAAQQRRLVEMVRADASECDAVVVADFGHGLFTEGFLGDLCEAVRPLVKLLVGDVSGQRANLLAMRHMDLICPSEMELRDALHNYDDGLTSVVWSLLERTHSQSALVTMGDDGLIAFNCHRDAHEDYSHWKNRLSAAHVPSFAPYAIDQLGCGDTLLAAATLTLAAGGTLTLAAVLGTIAAATQAQRLGNAVIGTADLRRGLHRLRQSQVAIATDSAPHAVIETPRGSHISL